MTMYILNVNVC